MHIQAVIQGAFIMAKARQDRQAASDSLDHLHRYVEMLFRQTTIRLIAKTSARKKHPR